MEKLIVASQNRKKLEELSEILVKHGFDPIPRDDAGIDDFEIVEDGETFEENSFKKANEIMKASGKVCLGDDSGLMVDYLGGAPGVYSARYAGEDGDAKANNDKLLKALENVPYEDRTAKFVTVITMCFPDGETIVTRGEIKGHIALDYMGEGGFGYDPIFVPEGYEQSFAQLGRAFKNTISHRARALEKLDEELKKRK